jgi:chromosome segregation ATPase
MHAGVVECACVKLDARRQVEEALGRAEGAEKRERALRQDCARLERGLADAEALAAEGAEAARAARAELRAARARAEEQGEALTAAEAVRDAMATEAKSLRARLAECEQVRAPGRARSGRWRCAVEAQPRGVANVVFPAARC